MSNVVLYKRDSGGSGQELSVDQQDRALSAFCADAGYTIVRRFADIARPGGTVVGRDAFLEMIDFLENSSDVGIILVWDFSRFARNYDDAQFYISRLRRKGMEVISLKEHIPAGPIGRVIESLHIWNADQYKRQLSENVKRGNSYLVGVHRAFLTGKPPTGYAVERVEVGKRRDGRPRLIRRLVPDPDAAPLVRRAFELRAEGRTIDEIHAETHLFANVSGYRKLFTKRIYLGEFTSSGVTVHEYCEPIVTSDLWQRAQTVPRRHPRRVRSSFLLSGLVRCARCGTVSSGHSTTVWKGHRYRYYACPQKTQSFGSCPVIMINADELERRVLERLRQVLTSVEMLRQVHRALADEYAGHADAAAVRLERIRSDLASNERARRKWLNLVESDDNPPRTVLDRLRELEVDGMRLREEAARIEAECPPQPPPAGDLAALGAETWAAIEWARDNDQRALQILVRSIVGEVRATRDGKIIVGDILLVNLPGIGRAALRLPL